MAEAARRRRSAIVAIPAVTLLAGGFLPSCGRGGEKRACVDGQNRVVDERECRNRGGIGRYYYYRGATIGRGVTASGGTYTKGATKSIGRGGFGGRSGSAT